MSDKAAKVPPHYAVPCCPKLDVEFLLDRHRDILIRPVEVSQLPSLYLHRCHSEVGRAQAKHTAEGWPLN